MTPGLELALQDKITSEVPVPVKVAVCGLPLALSEMLKVAVRCPGPEGVNVIPIEHVAPAATEVPHVVATSAKSPGFVPSITVAVMLKATPLALLRVNV
jgi:hypothetical protein